VVTLDRRKLAAPVVAQAAAFVVVLVIGLFNGHATKTPTPGPTHSASPGARPPSSPASSSAPAASSSSPAASSSSPAATKDQGTKLTVTVVENSADGLSVADSQVQVFRNGTTAAVASGTLNTARKFATNLPAGEYEVCVNPVGWVSAVPGTHLDHGFICSPTAIGSAPQSVTFHVVPKTTQAAA
jgi:hypothetical protein